LTEDEAVAQHSREAGDFARGYEQLERDPYATCFAYSRRRLDLLLTRLLPAARGDVRLLDVGCGTGHHLARLGARGYRGAGVDGSGAMLAQTRALLSGVPLVQGDVTRLPFATAAFDVALCVEVLRYLPDGRPLLREIARVLRPGGTCLVTAVPRLSLNGYPLVNRLLPRARGFSPLRQHFTSVRALRRELERAGLSAEAVHPVYWGPVNWVERLLPRLLPGFLRRWERLDAAACARAWTGSTANMVLAVARKRGERA
jgi:SAM-dependent methyltransferase